MTHSFDTEIAIELGIEKAIILQNIAFWIEKNAANDKHFYDGKTYTYNSYDAFEKLFPYMKLNTIKRCIREMEEDGILESRSDLNESKYDHTKWYCLGSHPIVKKLFSDSQKNDYHASEKSSSIKNNNQRQIINTDIKQDIKKNKQKKNSLEEQIDIKLSEYSNINLEAFGEWMDYKKYKSVLPVTKVLNFLSQYDFMQQKQIVDASIMNQWQGLFAPKLQTRGNTQQLNQTIVYDADPFAALAYDISRGGYEEVEVLR